MQVRPRGGAFGIGRTGLLHVKFKIATGARDLNRFTDRPTPVAIHKKINSRADNFGNRMDCVDIFIDMAPSGLQLQFGVAFFLKLLRQLSRSVRGADGDNVIG